jgi:aspartyl aminopeptidase
MDEKDRARYELSDQWVDRETEEYTIKEGGVEWLDRTLGIKGRLSKYIMSYPPQCNVQVRANVFCAY